jgi:type IV pilus assembly protein PilB
LKGVISQRLVRRICPHCRKPYKPDAEELEMLGMDPDADETFYRGAGCPECFNTGYRGRIAVFEMLPITRPVRALIEHKAGREEIEKALKDKEAGFVSLHDNGMRLVREGITTSREVLRVINEEL